MKKKKKEIKMFSLFSFTFSSPGAYPDFACSVPNDSPDTGQKGKRDECRKPFVFFLLFSVCFFTYYSLHLLFAFLSSRVARRLAWPWAFWKAWKGRTKKEGAERTESAEGSFCGRCFSWFFHAEVCHLSNSLFCLKCLQGVRVNTTLTQEDCVSESSSRNLKRKTISFSSFILFSLSSF